MEQDEIRKQIVSLLGGDDGLKRLKAQDFETIPQGVAFRMVSKNPGEVKVAITLSPKYYRVTFEGHALAFGPQDHDGYQGWEVATLFDRLKDLLGK